jgi:NAD(P)-dependent dehydrogenase (short-subunit alcohol dehydrogenase family)
MAPSFHGEETLMYKLNGKVAIVTGAGRHSGLGEGMARRLVNEGCSVVIADLGHTEGEFFPEHGVATTDEMEEVAQAMRDDTGTQVRTIACDVRDEAQVENMVATTIAELGRLDVLVNNAGIGYLMQLIVDTPVAEWDAVLDVNLKGTFLCTKFAARHMIEQGEGGRIINIASQAAKSAFPYASAYTSSKHGIIGFTRSAALELGSHGITVNAICPNHVTTGLGAWQNEHFSKILGLTLDEYMDGMKSRIPMGRTGQPDDIGNVCAWLASDEAGYITGEALNVSGGEEYH